LSLPVKALKTHFDEAYYARFYESKRTRVYGKKEVSHLARGITEMITWYGGTIRAVLDVGAGTGLWRDWFKAHKRGVRYVSTEVSDYACERYGHEKRDIARWRAGETFDLVVCQGVLPYLSDPDTQAAIENMASMCRGFLYIEAITARDIEAVVDGTLTDVKVYRRTGAWYRAHLDRHFVPLGCGLYYSKKGPLVFYELERA
jgi:2-polyprenyl-3-methyl-5-hydroxy-6-metoxy-1,4-benzoquinol methylase